MSEGLTVEEFLAASRRLLALLRSGHPLSVSQQKRLNDQIAILQNEWTAWLRSADG